MSAGSYRMDVTLTENTGQHFGAAAENMTLQALYVLSRSLSQGTYLLHPHQDHKASILAMCPSSEPFSTAP